MTGGPAHTGTGERPGRPGWQLYYDDLDSVDIARRLQVLRAWRTKIPVNIGKKFTR
jgi:hypothetical protein